MIEEWCNTQMKCGDTLYCSMQVRVFIVYVGGRAGSAVLLASCCPSESRLKARLHAGSAETRFAVVVCCCCVGLCLINAASSVYLVCLLCLLLSSSCSPQPAEVIDRRAVPLGPAVLAEPTDHHTAIAHNHITLEATP